MDLNEKNKIDKIKETCRSQSFCKKPHLFEDDSDETKQCNGFEFVTIDLFLKETKICLVYRVFGRTKLQFRYVVYGKWKNSKYGGFDIEHVIFV